MPTDKFNLKNFQGTSLPEAMQKETHRQATTLTSEENAKIAQLSANGDTQIESLYDKYILGDVENAAEAIQAIRAHLAKK